MVCEMGKASQNYGEAEMSLSVCDVLGVLCFVIVFIIAVINFFEDLFV